jgi:hypothetical protein
VEILKASPLLMPIAKRSCFSLSAANVPLRHVLDTCWFFPVTITGGEVNQPRCDNVAPALLDPQCVLKQSDLHQIDSEAGKL